MDNQQTDRWKRFGTWLKSKRDAAGRSQKEVAAQLNMHPVHLSRIETGDSGTRKETIDLLIGVLNLNAKEAYQMAGFWADEDMPTPRDFSAHVRAVLGVFDELSPADREKLFRVIGLTYSLQPPSALDAGEKLNDFDPPVTSESLKPRIDGEDSKT